MSTTAAANGDEAIALATKAIASADRNLKLAAEYLAFAEESGKTQRQIAKGVGKSVGWVNRLLQWRRDGYPDDTPFAAQTQGRDERHDERIRERERERASEQCSGPKQEPPPRQGERQQKRTGHKQRRADHVAGSRASSELNERDRDTLVKVLGMLGSKFDREVIAAARKAEDIRMRLGLTWDDLIAPVIKEKRVAA
jgi:hypothetical protein